MNGQALRESMRCWATGVAVVTSRYLENEHGKPVNSFTSVSLEPPLVMVALERGSRTCAMVSQSGVFGVTILALSQQAVAERFASRNGNYQDRFDNIPIQCLESSLALIAEGLAFIDCRVCKTYQAATPTFFIGQVRGTFINDQSGLEPLLYFNRNYQHIAKN